MDWKYDSVIGKVSMAAGRGRAKKNLRKYLTN